MKYVITESKLNKFLKSLLGTDLSNVISIVTNTGDLPMEFVRIITPKTLNNFLNHYGPMFVIRTRKNMYLTQDRGKDGRIIVNQNDYQVTETDVMKDLKIEQLGLSINDLINAWDKQSLDEGYSDRPMKKFNRAHEPNKGKYGELIEKLAYNFFEGRSSQPVCDIICIESPDNIFDKSKKPSYILLVLLPYSFNGYLLEKYIEKFIPVDIAVLTTTDFNCNN
jgi:hypothetical protein